MSRLLDELRQHGGSFPGGLYNVLAELDQRVAALESHKPMLDSLKWQYDAHIARQKELETTQSAPGDPDAENEAMHPISTEPTGETQL